MSRLDKLKTLHPELATITLMDVIAASDPSTTYKYCDFLIKLFKRKYTSLEDGKAHVNAISEDLFGKSNVDLLKSFEDHHKANRIRLKDISVYSTIEDIKDQVDEADEIVRIKELEKDVNKIYDKGGWLVLVPKTYESAMLYAKGTKWCITQKSYWNDYKKHTRIIFVINKSTDEKYAISRRWTEKVIQGWDEADIETSPLMWDFNDEIWKIIRADIKKTRQEIELDELPKDCIFGSKNIAIPLDESSLHELESFYKKYGTFLDKDFGNKIIERGKELREKDEVERRTVQKIKKTSETTDHLVNEMYRYIESGSLKDTYKYLNEYDVSSYNDTYNDIIKKYLKDI